MKPFFVFVIVALGLFFPVVSFAQEEEPEMNAFIFVNEEPSPLNLNEIRKAIGYPQEAISQNIEGTVILRVLIDKEGNYRKHAVVKEVHPLLVAAVEPVISQLKFSPAKVDANPVMYWMNIPFPFKLVDGETEQLKAQITKLTDELSGKGATYKTWHERGILRSRISEYDDAISDFGQSIQLNPRKNKKKAEKNTYDYLFYSHYGRATVYFVKQQFTEAITDFTTALDFASSMIIEDTAIQKMIPTVYLERGYTYLQMENYDQALVDFQWVLDNSADKDQKCSVYELMADAAVAKDDYPALIKIYSGMIECHPEDYINYFSRGYYKELANDNEGAIRDFSVVVENTNNINVEMAALNLIAWASMKQQNYDQAANALQKALAINILNPDSYFYLGKLSGLQNDTEKMCESFRKALVFGIEGTQKEEAIKVMNESCGGWEE
ncbi:MAG: TonB family protein [Bacteroidia bacterium]|nr:TonB family protein [Bacteroidia bacterium]